MEVIIKGNADEIKALLVGDVVLNKNVSDEQSKNVLSSASRQDATSIISDKMLFSKNDY